MGPISGEPARVTVPKSHRGLLTHSSADAPASRPTAPCLFQSDDRPIALAYNGDVAAEGPVYEAVRDSCRKNADLGPIVILVRPHQVSKSDPRWQRWQELEFWSSEKHYGNEAMGCERSS